MVLNEIKDGVEHEVVSKSVLWLVRYLKFIHESLSLFIEDDINDEGLIKTCVTTAYKHHLRKVLHREIQINFEVTLSNSNQDFHNIFINSSILI